MSAADRPSVYLAAPFEMQNVARDLATTLDGQGVRCTSRWMFAENSPSDNAARMCLEDIMLANVFVGLNPSDWERAGTGGRHVELGFALALWKPILMLGARTNVFHHLDRVMMLTNEKQIAPFVFAMSGHTTRDR